VSSQSDPQPEQPERPASDPVAPDVYVEPRIERVNDGTTQLAACTMAISC
jgi:hypothetical protein